ncbi:PRKC apoptosis WT1 regulator protein [Erpetoichthys calabaricus]|uniref:PRKC apoptosis WT1 regulator protein n=1 Tax=Erpetoichthys calabaricus TaxID=27687 RepID=UPI0022349943|nr:PRKC apoptosis WT1 regulator protein [Erpetoichthys calabaricus]XP_051790681.1 PRKC apoptosis WT1 regulator protein [Erpetoichthys calabaricus]
MATGGFRAPNTTTDFLEEWKAKREKMRAKMLGETAPGAASSDSTKGSGGRGAGSGELTNNGNPERASLNCVSHPPAAAVVSAVCATSTPSAMVRSPSSSALRATDDEAHRTTESPGMNAKKPLGTPQPDSSPASVAHESDKESSPSPAAKGKEKSKNTGPSARKGKGQIEKRKLREKRRSTGVVSIPSNESPDEFDDDDAVQKERKRENALTQQNTLQNETLSSDPNSSHIFQDTSRTSTGRFKSTATAPPDDEILGNSRYSSRGDRAGYGRHNREQNSATASATWALEKKIEELEKELANERQENARLLKAHQDKDEHIMKLKDEIDLLNRDLDDIEDENDQLKQENKTLLKVVGQLTR